MGEGEGVHLSNVSKRIRTSANASIDLYDEILKRYNCFRKIDVKIFFCVNSKIVK